MIEKNFELALDDEKLRRRNTQKLINTIEKAADLMIEGKKTTTAFTRYIYFIIIILGVLLILTGVGWIISSGGLDKAFENTFMPLDANKQIICYHGNESLRFKKTEMEEFKNFKEGFGENINCSITSPQNGL